MEIRADLVIIGSGVTGYLLRVFNKLFVNLGLGALQRFIELQSQNYIGVSEKD